jgi:hypothetical protein
MFKKSSRSKNIRRKVQVADEEEQKSTQEEQEEEQEGRRRKKKKQPIFTSQLTRFNTSCYSKDYKQKEETKSIFNKF